MSVPANRQASEDVIINAPMSFAGSAQRIFRLRRLGHDNLPAVIVLTVLALVLTVIAWVAVACWYLFFGLWLVPYRILRRGSRKRKAEALRHREMMATMQQVHQAAVATAVNTAAGAGLIDPAAASRELPEGSASGREAS